jgi:hypothetical protein
LQYGALSGSRADQARTILTAATELKVNVAQDTGTDFPAWLPLFELLANSAGHEIG